MLMYICFPLCFKELLTLINYGSSWVSNSRDFNKQIDEPLNSLLGISYADLFRFYGSPYGQCRSYVQTVRFVSLRVDSTPNFMSNQSTGIWDIHKSYHRSESLLKAPHAWRLNVRLKITLQFSVLLFYHLSIYL